MSERAAAAKAVAAAKAAELDERHQLSERAAAAKAVAAAKAAELDQKLGEKIMIEGFVGHVSTVQIDLKPTEGVSNEAIDEWIAWSQTEAGPGNEESEGRCRCSCRTDSSIFSRRGDQLSSQMRYLEQRRRGAAS